MKINWKKYLTLIMCISGICILKNPYISSTENTPLDIKQILINWQDNQYVNLVWFLPFLVIIYYSTSEFCKMLEHFEMRFQNRKRYIIYLLKKYTAYTVVITSITIGLQIIIVASIHHATITIIPWLFLIHYIIEMLCISLILVVLYLFLKNYIYTYLIIIGILLLLLITNPRTIHFPVISLFHDIPINIISFLLILINFYGIYKIYLHYDIGGAKYEVRN